MPCPRRHPPGHSDVGCSRACYSGCADPAAAPDQQQIPSKLSCCLVWLYLRGHAGLKVCCESLSVLPKTALSLKTHHDDRIGHRRGPGQGSPSDCEAGCLQVPSRTQKRVRVCATVRCNMKGSDSGGEGCVCVAGCSLGRRHLHKLSGFLSFEECLCIILESCKLAPLAIPTACNMEQGLFGGMLLLLSLGCYVHAHTNTLLAPSAHCTSPVPGSSQAYHKSSLKRRSLPHARSLPLRPPSTLPLLHAELWAAA